MDQSWVKAWFKYLAYFSITIFITLWYQSSVQGTTDSLEYGNFSITPSEDELDTLYADDEKIAFVIFPHCALNYTKFEVLVGDDRILSETHKVLRPKPTGNITCFTGKVKIKTKNIGQSNIKFRVTYPTENNPCEKEVTIEEDYLVRVQRKPRIELIIFRFGTMFFLIILNFGFGCSLNLAVVKEILRRPFAPAVGFTCQYFMMPIIGFCVSMTLLRDNKLFGFGLICSSCSPGGSGSNVWCLLLGGDVSLSLTMTFFSISASLVMMPLWIFLEGRFFIDTSTVSIPYMDILVSLAFFVVPLFIGIVFRKFKESASEKVGRCIKPFAFLFVVFLLTFGLYTNRYIYSIIGAYPYILIPALLQPYLGMGMGFLIATTIGRQNKQRSITIAIETGIQNITIPMVLLQNSFPQPLGDIAAVMPVTTAHFTPIPLFAVFLFTLVRNKFCPQSRDEEVGSDEVDKKDVDDLNHFVIEPDVKHAQDGMSYSTSKYNKEAYDATEKDVFLANYNNNSIGRKLSEVDQESVI